MQLALVGLPRSGRTTVFNALTRGNAPVADYSGKFEPNIGVAHVPDPRLGDLTGMFKPKRTIHAEVVYVDMPGAPEGRADSKSMFEGEALGHLQRADALVHVVRAFEDSSISHPAGSVNWRRDVQSVAFDLLFADIALLERRIEKLGQTRGLKAIEREANMQSVELIRGIQSELEAGIPIRRQELSDPQKRALSDVFLISRLPLLVILNIAEGDTENASELERELATELSEQQVSGVAMCGALEMELIQMSPDEEEEFRSSLDAGEPGLDRMIKLSYSALNLMSFLTVGEDEVRAWTIRNGISASRAAGAVHSDIERGFIRAEIVTYEDLMAAGGLPAAKKAGKFRSEGRDYVMQDGDVVNYLFSV